MTVRARKMDSGRFAPMLAPDRTSLEEIIHSELASKGSQVRSKLRFELLELNVYSTNLNFTSI